MKNKKINNLLVAGKKAALIGMLTALPLTKAHAYDERAYMTPGEQAEYSAYGTLPDDLAGKYDNESDGLAIAVVMLLAGGALIGGIYLIGKKQQQNNQQR